MASGRGERGRAAALLRAWLESEAAGGLLLMGAAMLAMLVANSALAPAYFAALHLPLGPFDLLHGINDGLMALFFLIVGLELKREWLAGELRSWGGRLLPGVAAVAGVGLPALIYSAVAAGDPVAQRGWAVPAATDIAFALGVLALLGKRVPASLRVFLAAIAIIDDLVAVLVIAFFYTDHLSLPWLGASFGLILLLAALNRGRVTMLAPYLLIGAALWWCVFRSGIHPTLAGVALALALPLEGAGAGPSPLERVDHGLHPWVAWGIVPLFGFANAGVSLAGFGADALLAPVPLGIALGLLIGKQAGVFGAVALLVRLGLAERPRGASWAQIYGVALLCGIGFTMSLFIGALAFGAESHLADAAKLGILSGSLLSALAGALVLRLSAARPG